MSINVSRIASIVSVATLITAAARTLTEAGLHTVVDADGTTYMEQSARRTARPRVECQMQEMAAQLLPRPWIRVAQRRLEPSVIARRVPRPAVV